MNSDENLRRDFDSLYLRARSLGLTAEEICQIRNVQNIDEWKRSKWRVALYLSFAMLVAAVAVGIKAATNTDARWFALRMGYGQEDQCLVENYEPIADAMRPVVDCGICRDVSSVDRVTNLTHEVFMQKYAFTGRPVVVTDGMNGWTAPEKFSFTFFKTLYKPDSPNVVGEGGDECQFFPYRTSFETLGEVFKMPKEMRDGVTGKPWYIGWSNCDPAVGNVLRKHYKKPYFLPEDVESSKTDWIFMGSPNYGAHMHIDAVGRVSWQAQVIGTKVWKLVPPPECWYECPHQHDVLLNTGDILVVDTNKWFHSTLILNNSLSITIGSEFE